MAACEPFYIENVNQNLVDSIIAGLEESGAEIDGNNPWRVDLNQHGIKLIAEWDPNQQQLKITVTNKNIYVGCGKIEDEMRERIDNSRGGDFGPTMFTLNIPIT